MNKILSIVIPSYNCEKFLDKCVSSMLCETVLDKLDIIIVNDGSTDSTEEVGLKYVCEYPQSVRLISQENRGHGGALNTGLENAIGKYVKVIDADDWVVTDNLPAFIEKLENLDADVVLTHHYTTDISNGEIKKWRSYPKEFEKPYNFKQIMSDWKSFDRSLTFHGITYNTQFYKQSSSPLTENVFYEDHEYATYPSCLARKIVPIDIFVYNYRIGDVTQSVSDANQLKRLGHTSAVIDALLEKYKSVTLPNHCKGREFAAMKIQGLLLSYVTTCLLVEKDRKNGRRLAKEKMGAVRSKLPMTYDLAKKQYRVFLIMNYLGISKKTWTKILTSKLYNKLRGNHDFS